MNNGFIYNPKRYVKNFKSLRTICVWAGCFGLVQSLIWITLTLFGILAYNCVINVDETFNYGNVFQVVLLQLYFLGNCENSIPVYDNSVLLQVKTVLSPADIFICISVYLAVAVCWFLASLLIMIHLKQDKPRRVIGVLWTWIVVAFCICAMDLGLGIVFGIDYGQFSRRAYKYNLSNIYAGAINPDAAQLLAGKVASMFMLVVSLKGFVLWIINFSFLIYLLKSVIRISHDDSATSNQLMSRDHLLANRSPINAYQEEEQKPSVLATVFANRGFEPDSQVQRNAAVINREIIARAARLSADVSLQERRFRNLDSFQQYPPRSRPESLMPEHSQQQQQSSPISVIAFPAPDYTPPMQRAVQNPNRNQRF